MLSRIYIVKWDLKDSDGKNSLSCALEKTSSKTHMEKAMAPHSSTLAWKIPWMKEPGRLQSMGLQRVRHD